MRALTASTLPVSDTPKSRRGLLIVLLLIPMGVICTISFILPVLRLAQLSFMQSHAGVLTDIYTFENYLKFFSDSFSLQLIWNSLSTSLMVTVITLLCAYPIALFLYRCTSRWRNLLFVITISPLLVSSVVRTFGWMVLLGDQGIINGALLSLHLIDTPFALVNNQLGVCIGLVETLIPYMVLSLIAGFGKLDLTIEEAAATLGAGRFTRFYRIILPMTMPGIALGSLFCFVLAISAFITPKLLGGGRVFLLATEIYDAAIVQLEWAMAATLSIVVLMIFGLTLFAYNRFSRQLD